MKDFSEVLGGTNTLPQQGSPQKEEDSKRQLERALLQDKLLKIASPVLLSLFTSPMMVASAYLQMSNKLLVNPIDEKLAAQR